MAAEMPQRAEKKKWYNINEEIVNDHVKVIRTDKTGFLPRREHLELIGISGCLTLGENVSKFLLFIADFLFNY